jgi:hypothetical protein
MTAKRKPKKAALVLTEEDRAVLSSLPDDERAMDAEADFQLCRFSHAGSRRRAAHGNPVRVNGRRTSITVQLPPSVGESNDLNNQSTAGTHISHRPLIR